MVRNRKPSPQTRRILAALMVRPSDWRYGYELAKQADMSSGTLYPLLMRLHERGLLEAKWMEAERPGRPPRHAYRLSEEGVALGKTLASANEAPGGVWPSTVRA